MGKILILIWVIGLTAANLFIDSEVVKRFAIENQADAFTGKCTATDGPFCFHNFSQHHSQQIYEQLKSKNKEVRAKSAKNTVGVSEGIKILDG